MTPLRKMTFLIMIIALIFFITLYFKNYIFLLFLFFLIILFSYKWYLMVTEEFVVYQLIKKSGKMDYDQLINMFGKKVKIAIKNLKKKEIIEQNDKFVILKKQNYKFSLKQMGKKKNS